MKKAEKLALRVEATYHFTGGSFIFFWVHDVSSFRMGVRRHKPLFTPHHAAGKRAAEGILQRFM